MCVYAQAMPLGSSLAASARHGASPSAYTWSRSLGKSDLLAGRHTGHSVAPACAGRAAGQPFRIVSGGRRALPERLRVERAAERWDLWLAVIQDTQWLLHAQAVPLGSPSALSAGDGAHCPSAYEWSEQLSDGTLLAVGGGAPSTVHLWNLQQEICMEQVWLYQAVLLTLPMEMTGPRNTALCLLCSSDSSMGLLNECTSCQIEHCDNRESS